MNRLIAPVFLLAVAACSDPQPRPPAPAGDSAAAPVVADGTDVPKQVDTSKAAHRPASTARIDTLRFAPATDSVSVNGEWSAVRHDSLYYFQVDAPAQLRARIRPVGPNFNIRFNQILMPDGSADGPFSQELTYRLAKKGWYALRLGPNLMAEGEPRGRFELTVRIR